ncbi:MAG TPA: hypothetical protein VF635_13430, partial [Propionibacteriaceae bacterium]
MTEKEWQGVVRRLNRMGLRERKYRLLNGKHLSGYLEFRVRQSSLSEAAMISGLAASAARVFFMHLDFNGVHFSSQVAKLRRLR